MRRFCDWLHQKNCLDVCEDSFNSKYCVSILQRSLKKKTNSVIESIEGYSITPEQKFRMRIVLSHLDYIEGTIAQVDSTEYLHQTR